MKIFADLSITTIIVTTPSISRKSASPEYDKIFRELVDLENSNPELITPDSPTQRVGFAPIEKFLPFRHEVPLLSLENAMNTEEALDFDRRVCKLLGTDRKVDYVAELKMDGLAVELDL